MKKFYASLAALAIIIGGVVLLNFANGVSKALPTDCDSNSIIYCGATSASSLASKYKANKTGDLDNIYHAYGLSDSEVTNAGAHAKIGKVYKDGRVTVGSETVATGARTIGRHYMSGSSTKSIGGKKYYERATSVSFGSSYIVAFVFFNSKGEFKAAIITSCGNPVTAKPKPKPVYTCNSLTATKISRTEYSFNASASAKNGATITGYTFDFGDGKKTTTTSKTAKHTYAKPGTYTAKLTANVKVGSSSKTVTATKCQVKITVAPEATYACNGLAATDISRNEYRFKAAATASNGATIESYAFDFGDGKNQTSSSDTVTHAYDQAGTYTVKVAVNVKVNGQTKTVNDEKCKVTVTVAPEPVYSCDGLESTKISRLEHKFDGTATAENGAQIIGYTFDFGDGKQQATTTPSVNHTYDKEGTYKAKMTVTVKVNGETKSVTSAVCEANVIVTPPNKVEVCNPETGEIIVVDEEDQDKYVPVGDEACKPVEVCNPETGEIIKVKPSEAGNYKPVGDAACQPKEECKPGIPVGDERCEEKPEECKPDVPMGSEECEPCPIPGKEMYSKNAAECAEAPAELPKTGMGDILGGGLGLGSLIAAGAYWYASRRGLVNELLGR